MSSAEFRERGHEMVDWIADYWDRLDQWPVRSQVSPGDIAAKLPDNPPEHPGGPEEWSAIFQDLEEIIVPGITHWQHPGFFAYFPANASGPSVLGELLSAGLGAQGMLWQTSPAMTEVETRMLDWMVGAFGLPDAFHTARSNGLGGGVIQSTASEATLVAMLAARPRALRSNPGLSADSLTAYASEQAHSSVIKAAMIAGLAAHPDDFSQVRKIEVDATMGMDINQLARRMEEDREAGRVPFFVCATVGTTATTGIDPVDGVSGVLGSGGERPWLHVDAAFAGVMALCPEYRHLFRGVDAADSFVVNAHKWLLTNFDCSLFWVRDRHALLSALAITPDYLRNAATESGQVIDYRDWQIPLGRRFRALKLWFVLRHYGLEGLRSHLRKHMDMAAQFEQWVQEDSRFEVVAPRTSSLVCFRPVGSDAQAHALLDAVNATGEVYLTHCMLPRFDQHGDRTGSCMALRMAVGGMKTRLEDVARAWSILTEQAEYLSASSNG